LCFVCVAGIASLFALHNTLYQLEEALFCWLLFSMIFVVLAAAVFSGVAIFLGLLGIIHWLNAATRAISPARLSPPTPHPK